MRFVVCTHSYLLLVEATPEGVTDVRVLDHGYFDGADVMGDGTILACQKAEPWSKRSPTLFGWYDTKGPLVIPALDGSDILDPHQLTLSADQRGCWNLSCATNEIVYKSLRDSEQDWRHWFEAPEKGQDWNHLNSVEDIGDLLFVVFHNLRREHSEIRQYGVRDDHLVLCWRKQLAHWSIHNAIWARDDEDTFYYNASDDGCIIRFPFDSKYYLRCRIGEQWHPKGMTVTDQYVVSGYSEHAVSTPRRFVSESGLCFVDRESWALAGMVPILLPEGGFVGNINEVRFYAPKSVKGHRDVQEAEKGAERANLGQELVLPDWDEASGLARVDTIGTLETVGLSGLDRVHRCAGPLPGHRRRSGYGYGDIGSGDAGHCYGLAGY